MMVYGDKDERRLFRRRADFGESPRAFVRGDYLMALGQSSMTIEEVWEKHGGRSVDLNLSDLATDDATPAQERFRRDRLITIQGCMHGEPAIYYGWYILNGTAHFWSAPGSERLGAIFGRGQLMR